MVLQSQTRLKQLSMYTCSHGEHRTAPWEAGSKLGLPGKRQTPNSEATQGIHSSAHPSIAHLLLGPSWAGACASVGEGGTVMCL